MESADEAALLERAREYDLPALGELYDRYAAKIHTYIYYHVGDQQLAEDLTASVFIKVLDAIKSSKGWQLSFSGWLYRIAHNAIVDHFRRHEHDRSLPLDERLVAAFDDPVAAVESIISSDALKTAMLALTDEQKMVIALKYSEGLSNLEVAETMGKTEGAIKSLQYRALAAMRRYLENDSRGKDGKRHRDDA